MAEPKKCLVCGSTDTAVQYSAHDFLVSDDDFNIMKCKDCGFVFTADPPDERDLGQYYLSEDYVSHSDRKKNITEVIYHAVRRFMLHSKFLLISNACNRKPGTLLDIGSGTGYFGGYMKNKAWEVTGIELSERARNFSFSKFGLRVIPPEKVKSLPDRHFDCVTMWHVMEHLSYPDLWLSEILRIMKDGGKCIVAMPNIDSADSKWFGNDWAALDVPRHLWHFSPETFNNFVQREGFRCIKTKGMPFDLFYISVMSYKNRKTHFAFIRGMATGLMLTIKNSFTRNSSSSLIYVLEKQ